MLKLKKLSSGYREKIVLRDISFEISSGDFIALLGKNGAGKSTLIKNIVGEIRPKKESIFLENKDISSLKREEIARKIAYISQYNRPIKTSVFDSILIGRYPHIKQGVSQRDLKIVEEIIKMMNLEILAMRNTETLSGGEFQKVLIARALAQEPKVLLLDEPTGSLDIKNQVLVLSHIKEFCVDRGVGVLMSIHDINLALKYANKFLLLKDGQIYKFGCESVITGESIKGVYDIEADVFIRNGRKHICY